MRVLVICDDYWHPGAVVQEGLAPLADKGYEFDWIDDAAAWSAEKMAGYPVVIFSKSNNVRQADRSPWVTPQVEQAFYDYVAGGGGLLATHSGTVYKDTEIMRPLLGGTFVQHPEQCPVTVTPKAGHPLTAGVTTFTAKDEHYHMAMEEGVNDVFLTTTSEHGTQPGGWPRHQGAGRVCVLTPGHNVEVWLAPAYQALLDNVLRWCAAEG
jgi:uncharacterized protein